MKSPAPNSSGFDLGALLKLIFGTGSSQTVASGNFGGPPGSTSSQSLSWLVPVRADGTVYHYYEFYSNLCSTSNSWCSLDRAGYALQFHAYPGNAGQGRVLPGSIRNMRSVWYNGWEAPILTDVDRSGLAIRNTTLEGHVFCCGTISRHVEQRGREIVVVTSGSGINPSRENANTNIWGGYAAFKAEDQLMSSDMARTYRDQFYGTNTLGTLEMTVRRLVGAPYKGPAPW
jgi:hypothetical protein